MMDRIKVLLDRLQERLWVRPAAISLLSIAVVFLATTADFVDLAGFIPDITSEALKSLLQILAASMLVIATFAVGAMVSSYASASNTATPRSFPLVVADDVSQNALSSFVGAFIFSIVALIALLNDVYAAGGRFVLFVLTVLVFAIVILTFVRWVDRIARLGRLGTTVEKAEAAARVAFEKRLRRPTLGGYPVRSGPDEGEAVFGGIVGHVQQIDIAQLQKYAERTNVRIRIAALPGTFVMPDRPIAFVMAGPTASMPIDPKPVMDCFKIADDRTFEDDPRFGLTVLSEIASRALSPAMNDPGTAISIINAYVRLFVVWNGRNDIKDRESTPHDRVEVPEITIQDMFDDAFVGVARDGAETVEVGIRLQKALKALATIGDADMRRAAEVHARLAFARAEKALDLPEDVEAVLDAGLLAGRTTASKA